MTISGGSPVVLLAILGGIISLGIAVLGILFPHVHTELPEQDENDDASKPFSK